jgi:hypothetical protein
MESRKDAQIEACGYFPTIADALSQNGRREEFID